MKTLIFLTINRLNAIKSKAIIINPKFGYLLFCLVVLNNYSLAYYSHIITNFESYRDFIYFSTMISYTLITLGIFLFQLIGFELLSDHFTLWLIVISCIICPTYGGKDNFYLNYMHLLGLILSVFIIVNRKKIKTTSFRQLLIGILWLICTIAIALLLGKYLSLTQDPIYPNLTTYIIKTFRIQLSFIAVIEETSFRGLLFGIMVMNGVKKDTALIIQGLLFWGMHFMDINTPGLFFVFLPIMTMSITLLFRKYNALYLTIIVHLMVNLIYGFYIAGR